MRTYDCPPTLTDSQVLEFCKKGFLMLEGVVPDEINRRTFEYLETDTHYEPTAILEEDWFHEHVTLNPQAIGAVRSLLGKNVGLPIIMSNHRVHCPAPAQRWHRDGGSTYGPELQYLQVFYYPQECSMELGPTALLPGSHFLFSLSTHMGHYGNIRGTYYTAAPVGSILLTVYSIWHRRTASIAHGTRNLLKYNYWRTAPPQRDWIIEPDFDVDMAHYESSGPTFRVQFQDCFDAAQMFFWLCGRIDEFRVMGGQGWPIGQTATRILGKPYGIPDLASDP